MLHYLLKIVNIAFLFLYLVCITDNLLFFALPMKKVPTTPAIRLAW